MMADVEKMFAWMGLIWIWKGAMKVRLIRKVIYSAFKARYVPMGKGR